MKLSQKNPTRSNPTLQIQAAAKRVRNVLRMIHWLLLSGLTRLRGSLIWDKLRSMKHLLKFIVCIPDNLSISFWNLCNYECMPKGA